MVYYYDDESDTVIYYFNEQEQSISHLNKDGLMSFNSAGDVFDEIKLYGLPASAVEHDGELLMQFDTMYENTGFFDSIDGYCISFFVEDIKDINPISFKIDRS